MQGVEKVVLAFAAILATGVLVGTSATRTEAQESKIVVDASAAVAAAEAARWARQWSNEAELTAQAAEREVANWSAAIEENGKPRQWIAEGDWQQALKWAADWAQEAEDRVRGVAGDAADSARVTAQKSARQTGRRRLDPFNENEKTEKMNAWRAVQMAAEAQLAAAQATTKEDAKPLDAEKWEATAKWAAAAMNEIEPEGVLAEKEQAEASALEWANYARMGYTKAKKAAEEARAAKDATAKQVAETREAWEKEKDYDRRKESERRWERATESAKQADRKAAQADEAIGPAEQSATKADSSAAEAKANAAKARAALSAARAATEKVRSDAVSRWEASNEPLLKAKAAAAERVANWTAEARVMATAATKWEAEAKAIARAKAAE